MPPPSSPTPTAHRYDYRYDPDLDRTLVLDKTGTLTVGRPAVVEVTAVPGRDPSEVLRLAAATEQFSPHVLGEALVAEARARHLDLPMPEQAEEQPGRGVAATLGGWRVEVGKRTPASARGWEAQVLGRAARRRRRRLGGRRRRARRRGAAARPAAPRRARTIRRLRAAGLRRLVMLTGDRAEPAREVAAVLGLDDVRAEQTPADKVAARAGPAW